MKVKSKSVTQSLVNYTMAQQQQTYLNYGKTYQAKKTCHNKKRKEVIVPIIPTKVVKLIVEVTTQPSKPAKVPLRYPCIICYSFEHRALYYFLKMKVYNMFCTKINTTAIVVLKVLKPHNVLINVVATITTCINAKTSA